jgi:hypothetical protein
MQLREMVRVELKKRECAFAGCPRHARGEGPDAPCTRGLDVDQVKGVTSVGPIPGPR